MFVAENRTEESLNGFWAQWPEEHREAVTAVAMDMWDPLCAIHAEAPTGS